MRAERKAAMLVCAPWEPAAVLRGARVLLRPLAEDDATELLAALDESREHFFPWLRFANRLRTLEDCREYIVRAQSDWLRGARYSFAVCDPATDHLLGGVDLVLRDGAAGIFYMGYWLRASAEGHGYMGAAVRLVTRFAFERVGAARVEITCDIRNVRSAAVAKRLGFLYEGALRNLYIASDGTPITLLIFARIPDDPLDAWPDDG